MFNTLRDHCIQEIKQENQSKLNKISVLQQLCKLRKKNKISDLDLISLARNVINKKEDTVENFCALGLFGNCSQDQETRKNVENNTTIISQDDVKLSNEQTNQIMSKEILKSASECNATTSGTQVVDIQSDKDITFEGDINQKMTVKLDFSCVNDTAVKSAMTADMLSNMMAGLQSEKNNDIIEKLHSKTTQEDKKGFASSFLNMGGTQILDENTKNNFTSLDQKKKE
jgi:hypothetical protein